MANSALPLTFGVEFELVFAFHESLLQAHLDAGNPGAPIVKQLTPAQRTYLSQAPTQYRQTIESYASWALTGASTSPAAKSTADGTIRTYEDEPLHVANSVLPDQHAYVHQGPGNAKDFARWHLINDPSLIGVDRETLRRKLGDRIRGPNTANSWDSYGLELVSRVLPIDDASFAEIDTTLAAIVGTSTSQHSTLITPLCGLHVHVGLAPGTTTPNTFPLPTLQHLAYILTMYEPHISALHAPHRQDSAAVDLGSNRAAFTLDPARIVKKLVFDPTTRTVAHKNRWVYTQPLAEIRRTIFAPDMTLPRLITLMGGVKGLFVNWSYLLRSAAEGPATLEFRQHEGTLYGDSVRWWVVFVTGLVRVAERLAAETVVDGVTGESDAGVRGFVFEEWHENMSLVDLFDMMGLPEEGRAFLGGRVAFYAGRVERGREETPQSGSGESGDGDGDEDEGGNGEAGDGTVLGKRARVDDGDDAGEDG